jgi:hypothetical protein
VLRGLIAQVGSAGGLHGCLGGRRRRRRRRDATGSGGGGGGGGGGDWRGRGRGGRGRRSGGLGRTQLRSLLHNLGQSQQVAELPSALQ